MSDSEAIEREPGTGLPYKNFGLSLTSKVVSLGAHVVFVMLTARLFSKDEVAAIAITGILTILMDTCKGLGLGTMLLKRLPQIQDAASEEWRNLTGTYLLYSLLPPLALAGIGCLLPVRALPVAGLNLPGEDTIFRLGILVGLFTVLSNTNILVLQATQKFGHLAIMTLVTASLQRLLPCLAAALTGASLERFMWWSAGAAALGFAATCVPLIPLLRPFRFRPLAWGSFWPESRHYFGTSLLRYGATQVDQLFVAVLFPPATLAVYFMLRRLYSLSVVLIGSMIDAIVPELARQAGLDALAARGRLRELSRVSLFAGSAGAALMAGNGAAMVELLLGPGYGDDRLLIALFAGATALYFLYCFVQVDLVLFQSPERILWMASATAAANLVAGPLTSPWLGVHSLPLAMLSGYLLGLIAARWKTGVPAPPRQVWRLRELGAGLVVVALASVAPLGAERALEGDWQRAVAVNCVIAGLVALHCWRNRVGESLRRLGGARIEEGACQ